MKFFKWLGKSREKMNWFDTDQIEECNNRRLYFEALEKNRVKPSPTTFYPPIDKGGKDELE